MRFLECFRSTERIPLSLQQLIKFTNEKKIFHPLQTYFFSSILISFSILRLGSSKIEIRKKKIIWELCDLILDSVRKLTFVNLYKPTGYVIHQQV